MKDEKNDKDKKMSFDLMDHEDYLREFVRLMSLREKITNEEQELNTPSEEILEAIEQRKQKNINAVLAGADPEDINYVENYRNNLYNKTRKRIAIYRQAEIKQQKILQDVQSEISMKIAKQTKPIYEGIINNMCIALIELGKWIIQERQLRQDLNDNRILFTSIFSAMPTRLGDPLDSHSRFSLYLIEAYKRNYLKFEDIPAEFRSSWAKRDDATKETLSL